MDREVITKLDAARRQLKLAIRLYFDDGDLVATHTRACAAREIFEKHCKMDQRHRMFDEVRRRHPDATEKELWEVLNRARNFFKHPDQNGNLDATIELGHDDNKMTIFMAAYDCASLLDMDAPKIFMRYITWFVGTEPFYRQHLPELDTHFPGLDSVDAETQWAIGKIFVKLATPDGRKISVPEGWAVDAE